MRVIKMYCDRCGKEFTKWSHRYEEKIGIGELTYDAGAADYPYLGEQKDLCKPCYMELEEWWNSGRTAESEETE